MVAGVCGMSVVLECKNVWVGSVRCAGSRQQQWQRLRLLSRLGVGQQPLEVGLRGEVVAVCCGKLSESVASLLVHVITLAPAGPSRLDDSAVTNVDVTGGV